MCILCLDFVIFGYNEQKNQGVVRGKRMCAVGGNHLRQKIWSGALPDWLQKHQQNIFGPHAQAVRYQG